MLEIPKMDRPREKLQRKGQAALSDFELIEVIIGSGSRAATVGSIARRIQRKLHHGTESLNLESLTQIPGVSTAQACKILAGLELAKRHLLQDVEPLRRAEDIVARLDDIRYKQQEHFVCFSLDGAERLIAKRTITIGTLDTVMAHPREVFADAIVDRAASVIIAHNHPSGEAKPSHKDTMITTLTKNAGSLLGIPVRDHIIVTKTGYYSFSQNHSL